MAARGTDARLDALSPLRTAPAAEAVPGLTKALRGKTAIVAGKAARIAADRGLTELRAEIEAAFERLLGQPTKDDPGCLGKTALGEACDTLESMRHDLFLRGTRCVHPEPGWGETIDRSAGLRIRCLHALFRLHHEDAENEAARLLADATPQVRAGAAAALANGNPAAGVPLLRYKILVGDTHEAVMGDAFGSLLALDPEGSVEFLTGLLQHPDAAVADAAALALGESRRISAAAPLIAWSEDLLDHRVRVAYVALALLRSPAAVSHLLAQIREGSSERATAAARALGPFAYDPQTDTEVRSAAAGRAAVLAAYVKAQPR